MTVSAIFATNSQCAFNAKIHTRSIIMPLRIAFNFVLFPTVLDAKVALIPANCVHQTMQFTLGMDLVYIRSSKTAWFYMIGAFISFSAQSALAAINLPKIKLNAFSVTVQHLKIARYVLNPQYALYAESAILLRKTSAFAISAMWPTAFIAISRVYAFVRPRILQCWGRAKLKHRPAN